MCNSKANEGLDFRNFEMFNASLLAKQGWRILQNPQSLLAKILKAKYFPNSTFLNSRLKLGYSYTAKYMVDQENIIYSAMLVCG